MPLGQSLTAGSILRPARIDHPWVAQSVFTALVLLDLLLRFAGSSSLTGWPRAALVLGLLATVAAYIVPWSRLPRWAPGALAVVDLAVVGMSRMDPLGSGAGVLAVLPALYLGRHYGRRGVLAAGAATLLLVVVPSLVYLELAGPAVARTVMVLTVSVVVAAAIATAVGQLERQQRVSDAIVDSVAVGLVLIDRDGVHRSVNRTQEQIMALAAPPAEAGIVASAAERAHEAGQVYGRDGRVLPREEWPSVRAAAGEEFDDLRVWVGADPATRRALSVSARVVVDARGVVSGASLACHDITDLVRALEVKDEFVSSVSHELRTPLTSINGYAALMLEDDDLPAMTRGHLEVVVRNGTRLHRLVDDLLLVAQQQAGPTPVVRAPTDLAQVVRQCLESAGPAADAADVALSFAEPVALEVPVVAVDAGRMSQVVDNLLSNAVKHTPAGGRVSVTLVGDDDGVRIVVADTGIGIAPADRERLFTRFFRSRDTTDRAIPGMGLGLHIARTIVAEHGGRIEVDSEPGRGTTFCVVLPR